MEKQDYEWEAAGSLTPDLENVPHSGVHKNRLERRRRKISRQDVPSAEEKTDTSEKDNTPL